MRRNKETRSNQRNKLNLLKKIEIYELPDKEFETTILKKLKCHNTGRQLNEISKTMHVQKNENISKEKLLKRTKQKF